MQHKRTTVAVSAILAALLLPALLGGCGKKEVQRSDLILATTTSTQDSGLLDQWIPMFEKDNPYSVKVIAVGSGQAMQMGRDGEADVMLVHSPKDEEKLVADGFAINRQTVMHNDFVVVGPAADPAGIKAATNTADSFAKIAAAQAQFFSRGDNSGTHSKEKGIWTSANITPAGAWYVSTGTGMGDTLRVASEKQGYTLADRGTFLSLEDQLSLEILYQGDKGLFNQYHVMEVNPEKWPEVESAGAKAFVEFCISREAQEFLNEFGVEQYGEPLFFPDAL
jgi:tungstate transport system substrate-binding protein